jgi:hypothetical protein
VSRCSNVRARKAELFDHLVGAGENRRRHVEAERLGRLQVDHHITDFEIVLMVQWFMQRLALA